MQNNSKREIEMIKEYIISKRNHKKVFGLCPTMNFRYGLKRFKYYLDEDEKYLTIKTYYSWLMFPFMVIMFIPSILICGMPETLSSIKEVIYGMKAPYLVDSICKTFHNGKENEMFSNFMKYAKKKGN
jgi:hypothetical protein